MTSKRRKDTLLFRHYMNLPCVLNLVKKRKINVSQDSNHWFQMAMFSEEVYREQNVTFHIPWDSFDKCNTNKSLLVKWKFRARKSSKCFLQAVGGDDISPSSLLFFIQYAFQCLVPLNWIECAQSKSLLANIQRWGNGEFLAPTVSPKLALYPPIAHSFSTAC